MVLAQKEAYKSMNRIERSEINFYVQLIYGKEYKNIQWEKDNSSMHGVGKTGQVHEKN